MSDTAIARLMRQIERVADGCWLWRGSLNQDGYGRIRIDGRTVSAHVAAYRLLVGAIPSGLELDHLCRVRSCINPAHLEPVTHAENVRRGWPAQQAACVNGHPYDAANTYVRPNGRRDCRVCIRARVAAYKARKAASAA